jgi:hypothetical protein
MKNDKKQNYLLDIDATLTKIVVDLVDIYWEMKPEKNSTVKQLSEFSTKARISSERSKIAMKAIDELKFLKEINDSKKTNTEKLLSPEEIKLILDFRKNKLCK